MSEGEDAQNTSGCRARVERVIVTIKVVNLHKLLKLCELSDKGLISAVRSELRTERDKADGEDSGGGDFYVPFWSDAKMHVIGALNLTGQTLLRIDKHRGRKRLYPLLEKGFLDWFEQLRRRTNQPVTWLPERVHNHLPIPDLDLTVKVDNLLGLKIGPDKHLLVYPYFAEKPILSEKWARVGLWLMQKALPSFSITDMEILDVFRGRSFSGAAVSLSGHEEAQFKARYLYIVNVWNELKPEYGLA